MVLERGKKMRYLMLIVSLLLLQGCLGLSGTKFQVSIPVFDTNGKYVTDVKAEYLTDDLREIAGLTVSKQPDGSWAFTLDSSQATANAAMWATLNALAQKIPTGNPVVP